MEFKKAKGTIWLGTEYLSLIPSLLRIDSIREALEKELQVIDEISLVKELDDRIRAIRTKYVNDTEVPWRYDTSDMVDCAFLFLMIHIRDVFGRIITETDAEVHLR